MNELLNKTISQIVTDHHQTAAVFEKYGIDFCCKGKRPLVDACAEKQLNKEQVIQELAHAIATETPATDFNKMTLAELVDHIVTVHHTYVKFNLPQIAQYLSKVAAKHGDRFPFMKKVESLFAELQNELSQHMMKEERILFPRIKQLEKEGLTEGGIAFFQEPINVMEAEHDRAGTIMQQIRELTDDYIAPADACTTFRLSLASLQAFEADLHQHVHLENYILFPKTIRLFQQLTQSISSK
jgi:regulator of cell morphogenesis and NO signaling